MRRLLPVLLVLGACNPPPASDVAVSGPPATDAPEVLGATVDIHDVHPPAPATTTTTAPATTTTEIPREKPATPVPTTPTTAPPPPVTAAPTGNVHAAIAAHFGTGSLGQQAQRVAQCESGLNAGAVSPTNDHGLFQINRPTWDKPSAWDGWQQQTGTSWSAVYDPYVNGRFARTLYDRSGWSHWACRSAA